MATEAMSVKSERKDERKNGVGAPPLPHEHGAWVMLYAPLVIALAVTRPFALGPSLLLILAVTAAFLAREPADLLIRGRGKEGSLFWLFAYLGVMAASALPLLLVYHRTGLVVVGGIAGVLFALHALMLWWPSRRRMDRSESGEVLAVTGLTLTAPAAYATATGQFDGFAVCLWAVSILYFASSIFFVKMLLGGAKYKGEITPAVRLRIGRWNIAYHVALFAVQVWLAPLAGPVGGWLVALAYLPIVLRALFWNARLSRRLPNLKRIGFMEMGYALWFAAFVIAGLTVGQ
jgi:hypothetical protein